MYNSAMPAFIDLTGKTFGRLTVVRRVVDPEKQPKWLCVCVCGHPTIVFGNALRTGATESCGCLQREQATTHGQTTSQEFIIWQHIRQRCYNPRHRSYKGYGGRGITVCDRWNGSFEAFFADMGPRPSPRHTIERKDNAGPYEPSNCRWATRLEQGENKRNNRRITHDGQTLTLGQWCRLLNMRKSTLMNRLARWSVAEALSRPVAHKHNQAT